MGVDIIMTDGEEKGEVDLEAAMTGLALKGIDSILLEGGATLAASAFDTGIVDKVRIYTAPMIIGGVSAPGLIGGEGAPTIPKAIRLRDIQTQMTGKDLVIEAYVEKEAKEEKAESTRPTDVDLLKREEEPCSQGS